jgi:hypothetical protein
MPVEGLVDTDSFQSEIWTDTGFDKILRRYDFYYVRNMGAGTVFRVLQRYFPPRDFLEGVSCGCLIILDYPGFGVHTTYVLARRSQLRRCRLV